MTLLHSTLPTPDGPFSVVVDASHVLASGWTAEVSGLIKLIHPGLRQRLGEAAAAETGADELLERAARAVQDYYAGDAGALEAIPVRQRSGPFREHAWEVLREVEAGQPLSYAEYARRAGRPAAIRAAAGACAMNAAALFVPCHRIIRTDGGLGGFRYGLPIKESLLQREAALAPSLRADPRLESPAR